MKELSKKFLDIYNTYTSEIDRLNKEYEPYTDAHAYETYAQSLIDRKNTERLDTLRCLDSKYHRFIEEALSVRLSKLEPDTNIINSLEYQTKLSNTLSLLNMTNGNIDGKSLNFIAEARDIDTLKAIKDAYKENTNLAIWIACNDLSANIERMERNTRSMIGNINFANDSSLTRTGIIAGLESIE